MDREGQHRGCNQVSFTSRLKKICLQYRPGWDKLFVVSPLARNRNPAAPTWLSQRHTHPEIQPAVLTNSPHLADRKKRKQCRTAKMKGNRRILYTHIPQKGKMRQIQQNYVLFTPSVALSGHRQLLLYKAIYCNTGACLLTPAISILAAPKYEIWDRMVTAWPASN